MLETSLWGQIDATNRSSMSLIRGKNSSKHRERMISSCNTTMGKGALTFVFFRQMVEDPNRETLLINVMITEV